MGDLFFVKSDDIVIKPFSSSFKDLTQHMATYGNEPTIQKKSIMQYTTYEICILNLQPVYMYITKNSYILYYPHSTY